MRTQHNIPNTFIYLLDSYASNVCRYDHHEITSQLLVTRRISRCDTFSEAIFTTPKEIKKIYDDFFGNRMESFLLVARFCWILLLNLY